MAGTKPRQQRTPGPARPEQGDPQPARCTEPAPAGRFLARREFILLAVIFLAALALRTVHFWGQWTHNPLFLYPVMDERVHHEWARQLASGEGLGPRPFFRAPLYYYGLAGLYRVFGPNIPLARFLGCALGALTCVLIARLGMALGGRRVGLLAGVIAAVYWPFIHLDQQLLSVGLETFLNVLLLLVLLEAVRRGSAGLYALAGVVWGLSAITRPNILTFAPFVAVWLGWWAWRGWEGAPRSESATRGTTASASPNRARPDAHSSGSSPGGPWRLRTARNLALIGLGGAAMVLPVTFYNRIVGGEWVLVATNGGLNFWIGNNPESDGITAIAPGTRGDWEGGYEDTHVIPERELGRKLTEGEISDYWYAKGWAWIRENPAAATGLTLLKLARFWTPVEIPNNHSVWFFAQMSPASVIYWIGFPVVAVLGLAGLVLLRRDEWRAWLLPVLYGLATMGTVIMFFCVERYRLPMVPVLILLAAAGLTRVPELWRARRVVRLTGYVAVVLLAAALQVGARPGGVFWPPPPFEVYGPPEYEGRWFQQQEDARGEHALGGHFLKLATQDKERLPDAIHHYREATRILPQWPEALVSLGAALLNLRDAKALEEAGRAFAFAVELRPTFIEGRLFYGEWLRGMGRHEESLAQFREVTVRQPWGRDYHVAMLNLGIVLADLGRYPEAGDWLVRAVQNRPGDANATERLAGLARGHHTHGDPADAAALLERGLKHAPESLPLLKELGAAYQKMGKLREATEVAERAARIARAAGNLAAAAQWEEAARKLRAMQAGG